MFALERDTETVGYFSEYDDALIYWQDGDHIREKFWYSDEDKWFVDPDFDHVEI